MSKKSSVESDFSGSTCILALIEYDQLYIANTGDSRAILGKRQVNYLY